MGMRSSVEVGTDLGPAVCRQAHGRWAHAQSVPEFLHHAPAQIVLLAEAWRVRIDRACLMLATLSPGAI